MPSAISVLAEDALSVAKWEYGGLMYLLEEDRWSYLAANGSAHTLPVEQAQELLGNHLIEPDPRWGGKHGGVAYRATKTA